MATIYKLQAGYVLTVTAGAERACVQNADDGSVAAFVSSTFSQTFGPYLVERGFLVSAGASVSMAAYTTPFGGLLIANAGAPVTAVASSAAIDPAGDDNGLIFTAKTYGEAGDNISVRYVDPGANDASLSVDVVGTAITVNLATGVAGAITSTAAEVKAAVEASAKAAALVTVEVDASDTGEGDDGSGVVTEMVLANLADGAGTGIGAVLPGALCIDTTNADVYRNDGSTAAPTWVKLGDAA